jgi:hypothetical protein
MVPVAKVAGQGFGEKEKRKLGRWRGIMRGWGWVPSDGTKIQRWEYCGFTLQKEDKVFGRWSAYKGPVVPRMGSLSGEKGWVAVYFLE